MFNTPVYRAAVGIVGLALIAAACAGPADPSAESSPELELSGSPPIMELEALEQLPIAYHVRADDLEPWPYLFDQGTLTCDDAIGFPVIVITPIPAPPNDSGIAVNEEARRPSEVHAPRPDEWALDEPWTGDNPELRPLLEAGLELCSFHDLKSAMGIDATYGNAAEFADRASYAVSTPAPEPTPTPCCRAEETRGLPGTPTDTAFS